MMLDCVNIWNLDNFFKENLFIAKYPYSSYAKNK